MKVCLYARVSTDEQTVEQLDSGVPLLEVGRLLCEHCEEAQEEV